MLACCSSLLVTTPPEAIAIIDGALFQLTREGVRGRSHEPLATAVVEFRHGPFRYYVREHTYGLLPGLANLYCLDGALRLLWIAQWPEDHGPCVAILGEDQSDLVAVAADGTQVRLNANRGSLIRCEPQLAATG